jgi:hypothetical protein
MKSALHVVAAVCMCGLVVRTAPGQEQKQPQIVGKILKVEYAEQESHPPNLVVTAVGQVPTGGYSKPALLRAIYKMPPEDGIQDYFLVAVPPSGPATQVISQVKASDQWKGYTKEAPWIKGIRVHGLGDGVVVKVFSKSAPGAGDKEQGKNERTFEGQSKDGDLQDALHKALEQLDKTLGEDGVADAMATWKITDVSGERGGIAVQRTLKVTITASRTPPWNKKGN